MGLKSRRILIIVNSGLYRLSRLADVCSKNKNENNSKLMARLAGPASWLVSFKNRGQDGHKRLDGLAGPAD